MIVRLIVRTLDGGYGINIGGPGTPFESPFRTFDIECPELEQFLNEPKTQRGACYNREVIGAEILGPITAGKRTEI